MYNVYEVNRLIQHIGIAELKKLNKIQLEYLQEWYFKEHKGKTGYTQSDIVSYENHEVPLLTIGQMIDILDEKDYSGYKKIDGIYYVYDVEGNMKVESESLIESLFNYLIQLI